MLSKIIFNSPWYYFLLSLLLALVLAGLLYYRNSKNTDVGKRVLAGLFLLRFSAICLILFLLLNIFFRRVVNETEKPLIIFAIDNSSSITANADSTFIKEEFLKNLFSVRENLEKKYAVKTLYFGSEIRDIETPDFNDHETDFDKLLSETENNFSNQNVGALVIASDGIFNKGANPLYAAEKLAYPVYAIAMGDTAEKKDVLIKKVQHNEMVYAGNDFPVEVIVNAKKFKGSEVKVTLQQSGSVIQSKVLPLNSDNFVGTVVFTITAKAPGLQRYNVQVSELQGDKIPNNNSQSFVIEVINNREKILVYAPAPHPDVAAISEALTGSPNYEVTMQVQTDNPGSIKAYNLVIIHGYSLAQLQFINACKTAQIPFLLVNPNTTEQLPGLRILNTMNRYNDAEPYVNTSFGFFSLSDPLRKFISDLPAVRAPFGRYELSNGSNMLLGQKLGAVESGNPMFYFTETGGIKAAVFMGDGLWQWHLRDYAAHKNHFLFNELMSKTVQFLSVKGDKSFFRVSAPRIVDENTAPEILAELYNKSYELTTDAEVILELTNDQKKKFNYTFNKLSASYKLSLGQLPAGDYQYRASTRFDNELFVKQGQFAVKEVIAEKLSTTANHQMLHQLSDRTGGSLFYPQQLQKLEAEILNSESIKPITYSQTTSTMPIELKWLFWLFLALFGVEWFFRKRFLNI